MNKIKLASYLCFTLLAQSLMGDLNLNTTQSSTTGNSVTAWENYIPSGTNIFASTQILGVWSASVPLADPLTYPSAARTGINSADQIVVIWLGADTVTFTQSLFASVYDVLLGTWSTPSLLSDPALEYVIGDHQVRIANNGTIVVTWAGYMFLTGTNEARAIYTTSYGTWPAPVTIP